MYVYIYIYTHGLVHLPLRQVVKAAGVYRICLAHDPTLLPAPRAASAVPVLLDARVDIVRLPHVDASLFQGQHVYAMPHFRCDLM